MKIEPVIIKLSVILILGLVAIDSFGRPPRKGDLVYHKYGGYAYFVETINNRQVKLRKPGVADTVIAETSGLVFPVPRRTQCQAIIHAIHGIGR